MLDVFYVLIDNCMCFFFVIIINNKRKKLICSNLFLYYINLVVN